MTIDTNASRAVSFAYTNWKGETSVRRVIPKRSWFGATEWHHEPQWLLWAFDLDKQDHRDFALRDVRDWQPIELIEAETRQRQERNRNALLALWFTPLPDTEETT